MSVILQVTKCTFHKFGPSGTVQKFDGLCVLPLNIINEKIYVFLWFWFVILAITTGIQVNYFSYVWSTRNRFNVFRRYDEHDILTAGCVQSVDLLPAGNEGYAA